MKVIGVTATRYIVEMEPIELSRLASGKYESFHVDSCKIGVAYNVTEAWNCITGLINGAAELPKIANKLRALADLLEPISVEIPTHDKPAT